MDARKAKSAAARHAKKSSGPGDLQYILWAGGAFGSIAVACLMMVVSPARGPFQTPVNDAGAITHVNRNSKTWRAGACRHFDGWTVGDVKTLQGIAVSARSTAMGPCQQPELDVPEAFDARTKWPQCFTKPVYSMGNCTASWAIATASAITDRFCISSPLEHRDLRLSPQHMLSCDNANRGCGGGDLDTAWQFVERSGLVSEACFPYEGDSEPSCQSKCSHERPMKAVSHCLLANEFAIRREIYANGPVVAPLLLSDDFLVYKQGIYLQLPTSVALTDARRQPVIHAVKVVGWGSSAAGMPYWIIENSFGEAWGEKGFGMVARGGDPDKKTGVLVEQYALAGIPASGKLPEFTLEDEDWADEEEAEEDFEEG